MHRRSVRHHDHVGANALAISLEKSLQISRTNFLLAFDQHLDVYGQFTLRLQVSGKGTKLGSETMTKSDLILPADDMSLAEAKDIMAAPPAG